MIIFKAENIIKQYQDYTALDEVSIEVKQGEIFGLLGPNGAGKTTLIRIINQITAPDKGQLFFEGRPLKSDDVANIGYLPEERGLYKKMKVGEQAVYLARLKGLSKNDALKRLKYWFQKFEIEDWWGKKVEELSKGMAQKVQFIITILHEPKLLIFDEPFSGFDPINANLLKNEILELKEKGASIIFSTHNMSSVEELCDHIALINKSKKILDGNIDHVKEQYKNNMFEFEFQGEFDKMKASMTADYKLIEYKQNKHKHRLKMQIINPKRSTNQLIEFLLPFGSMVSYNEVIPSMNDIFIKVVEDINQGGNENE